MNETEYMYVVLRRAKDQCNVGLPRLCRRFVGGTWDDVYKKIHDTISHNEGYFRIYRSVNKRDLTVGAVELQVLLARGEIDVRRVDSEWKSLLMRPVCKATNLWLIDIDTKDESILHDVISYISDQGYEYTETPNGHHIVCKRFDNRELLKKYADIIEFKTDALLYITDSNDKMWK